jgi:hypothetical protein
MPEVPSAGHDHRETVLVGGGDHFLVTLRAAGMHDGGRAGLGYSIEAVAKRKERV